MKKARNKNGFGVVELLIALAITAMLLVAVAVAFNASMMNYRHNEDTFNAVNRARQALFRITTQLRTGYMVDPCAPSNECSFYTAGGDDITYEYRNADDKLYLITNSNGQEYVLCDNITAMSFIKTPKDDGSDCKSVQISITVVIGGAQQTVSSAAVIRRNMTPEEI